MADTLGPIGPILGSEECKHEAVTYYEGYEGVYAVCHSCHGHFWDAKPPEGAEVINLNTFDDEAPDECSHGVAWAETCEWCEELTARWHASLEAAAPPLQGDEGR